jgi:hypothetical protein
MFARGDIMMKARPYIFAAALTPFLLIGGSMAGLAQDNQETAEQQLDDFSDIQQELEDADKDAEDNQAGDNGEASDTPETLPNPETDSGSVVAQSEEGLARIAKVIDRVDDDATRDGNSWQLTIDERQMLVVTDVNAGRMRIMTPIAAIEDLPEGGLLRLMQANFDSALDARYAVAQDLVWGTFIHPLPSLTERDFASGLLQTKTVADTFGTTFSSGAITFGGGDSNAIITDQLEELLKELEKENAI